MSSKGPGLFSDIGKKAREFLSKGYSTNQEFTVTTYSDPGLVISSKVEEKRGLSSGDITVSYKLNNTTVDLKVDTESNVLTTFTSTDILPSTRTIASLKLPNYRSGKLEVQYLHEHASFTTAFDLNESPAVDFSATIGTPSIAFGLEGSYLPASRKFAKYNAGVSLTKPDSIASVILANKGDSLCVSYLHELNQLNGGAVVGEINRRFSSNENTLTVGCLYVIDFNTMVKVKLNNHGNLGALVQHQVTPKSVLTISGALETMALEKNPKFGLAVSFKP